MYQSLHIAFIDHTAVGLDHLRDQFHDTGGRVKLTVLLRAGGCVCLQEVFINPADQILLLKPLFIDLVDIVDQIFDL